MLGLAQGPAQGRCGVTGQRWARGGSQNRSAGESQRGDGPKSLFETPGHCGPFPLLGPHFPQTVCIDAKSRKSFLEVLK
jgi:hypothetical protein